MASEAPNAGGRRIQADARTSLLSYLDDGRPLAIDESGRRVDRNEFDHLVGAIAELVYYAAATSQQPSRVAVCIPTSVAYLASVISVWKADGIGFTIGQDTTAAELERLLDKVQPSVLIHARGDARYAGHGIVVGEVDALGRPIVVRHLDGTRKPLPLSPDDAWLAGTSGSTGESRHAVLTFTALEHNIRSTAELLQLGPADRVAVFTKSQFTYAMVQMTSALAAGCDLAIWSHGVGTGKSLWRYLEDVRATGISANPTAFSMLLRRVSTRSQAPMRYVMTAGQALPHRLVGEIRQAFPQAVLINAYGCTENTNRIAWSAVSSSQVSPDQPIPVGRTIPGVEIVIGDRPPHTGEVGVSGSSLMRGYLDDLRTPDDRIARLWTGDLGFVNKAGELVLTGRVKTVINVANEPVSPEEVERLALTVDDVSECAVGGVEHDLLGEVPYALLSLKPPGGDSEQVVARVQNLWKTALSPTKRPLQVRVVADSEIPRTQYGKIDRRRLKELLNERSEGM